MTWIKKGDTDTYWINSDKKKKMDFSQINQRLDEKKPSIITIRQTLVQSTASENKQQKIWRGDAGWLIKKLSEWKWK